MTLHSMYIALVIASAGLFIASVIEDREGYRIRIRLTAIYVLGLALVFGQIHWGLQ